MQMASIQSTRGWSLSRMRLRAASELAGTSVECPLSLIFERACGCPQQYEMVS
jgi:hypothetical protein